MGMLSEHGFLKELSYPTILDKSFEILSSLVYWFVDNLGRNKKLCLCKKLQEIYSPTNQNFYGKLNLQV